MKSKLRQCKWCGKMFVLSEEDRGKPIKYCSDECRKAYRNNHLQLSRKRPELFTRTKKCRVCKKEFIIRTEQDLRVYCSLECQEQGKIAINRARYKKNWRFHKNTNNERRYDREEETSSNF